MTEKRIKSAVQLIGEALVIWYGMGTPVPTNPVDAIKLLAALGAITYTGWKNHDFTAEACEGTGYTRQLKAENRGMDTSGAVLEAEADYLKDGDEDE